MSGPKFDPHDPRLTAYVLGELDEDARADVEALLETSPEARAAVNDLGDLATWLEEDLARESACALSEDVRTRIRTAASAPACEFSLDPLNGSLTVERNARGTAAGGPVVLSALVVVVALCLLTLVLPTEMERKAPGAGSDLAATGDTHVEGRSVVGYEFAAVSNTIADRAEFERESRTRASNGWLFGAEPETLRDSDSDGTLDGVSLPGGIGGGAIGEKTRFVRSSGSGAMRWGAWYDESGLYYVPSQRSGIEMSSGATERFDVSQSAGTIAEFVRNSPNPHVASGHTVRGGDIAGFGESGRTTDLGAYVTPTDGYGVAVNQAQRGREVERLARANLALADLANRRQERVLQLRTEQQNLESLDPEGEKPAERIRAIEERVLFEQNELVNVERKLKQVQLAQLDANAKEAIVNFVPLERGFVSPVDVPVSNPKVAVQTDSYHWARLNVVNGTVPPPDTVRVEDFVNYFAYTMPEPERDPVGVVLEAGPCPWNADHRLVRVALKGREADAQMRPPTNVTFLLDFKDADESQVGLVQHGLRVLNDGLAEKDRLSIVANGPESKVWLDANGDDRQRIRGVIDNLESTTFETAVPGIRTAYANGNLGFVKAGVNSVVICTDRNGLLGNDDATEVDDLVREQAGNGLSLNVVQFGRNVPPDGQLVELARVGNGRFAQVGGADEVREVFTEELLTRPVVAEDIELHVEFNPARVNSYRLVGFDDPPVTAGKPVVASERKQTLSAGQRFTALYEIEPRADSPAPVQRERTKLRYQQLAPQEELPISDELLALKLEYRRPGIEGTVEFEDTLVDEVEDEVPSREFGWASAVAAYGLVLRDSAFKGTADLDLVERLVDEFRGSDPEGEERAFVELVRRTRLAKQSKIAGPQSTPVRLSEEDARFKASVGGKYTGLLERIEAPEDHVLYSRFDDFGWWEATTYRNHDRLPKAHWVYVYPHWYLWGERATSEAASPAVEVRGKE